jgi:hypothetical protein
LSFAPFFIWINTNLVLRHHTVDASCLGLQDPMGGCCHNCSSGLVLLQAAAYLVISPPTQS